MKKIICLLLMLVMMCACTNKDDEFSIVVPSGAPSIAFYKELSNSNFHTSDAQSILTELKSNNGADIVVIDTINGIRAINAGADYSLAATITFGNFYIASTGLDDNGTMDKGDYIVVFSKGATPDIVFHYLYGDDLDDNLHYVGSVNDALPCLVKGINITDDNHKSTEEPYVDYVMIAEPALSVAMAQNDSLSVYADVQELYKTKSNLDMIQASIFVRNNLDKSVAANYLNKIENDINALIDNPLLFKESMEEANVSDDEIKDIFGIPNATIVNKVLQTNTIGLGYKKAYDIKDSIKGFALLFGFNDTNENIYYK